MRKDVRILLVGDDGVGKSTLLTSLIRESFVENVPEIVPEVTIPPDVTIEKVMTHIVDSSSKIPYRESLEDEMRRAHVICIVYDVTREETFDRIGEFWIPYIRRLGVNVPLILVGNKIDARGSDIINPYFEDQVAPLMNAFKEIVTCTECSAKSIIYVPEVFYYAQKAVLHPTAPLYDAKDHKLKPKAADALQRIFRLSDSDKDHLLNDDEVNEFQKRCFTTGLSEGELLKIKELIGENTNGGLTENGITENGFLFLHLQLIQQGRLETVWTILRKFGYGEDLSLRKDFLSPHLEIGPDYSVELSAQGYQFFAELFRIHDKDKDGALSTIELEELFSTSPTNPWNGTGFPDTTITNKSGYVTLQGFLAQWTMTTLLDYKVTLNYLAYFGYDGDSRQALLAVKNRRTDWKKNKIAKNVFLCYVFGAKSSGKSALLRCFLNKPFGAGLFTPIPYAVVNTVEIRGFEKYLVMVECGPEEEQTFLDNRKRLGACDLIIFAYDSSDPNSFAHVAKLRETYKIETIPCIFVATKSDLDLVSQRYDLQPAEYCKKLRIPAPISISAKSGMLANLYQLLMVTALEPSTFIPYSASRERKKTDAKRIVGVLGATAGVAALGIVAYRLYKQQQMITHQG